MAQVRTRKRGKTFSYIFEAGKAVDGRRKVVEKGGFPTKDAAYKAGVAAYNDFLHGNIGITSERVTLKDFMTAWLDNVVTANVKLTTMQKHQSHFKNQILPHLGEVKVQDLTPAIIDEWMRKLLQTGLAKNTLSAIHALIHNALDYAVYPAQLISSNPVAYIKVPKNAPRNVIERKIITPEQFSALLEKYPFGSPFYIPLLLLYHTGMRLGEVLGLSWSDIDFTAKRITLRQQVVYINKRGHFLTSLKTESSNRYVLVDDFLLGELRRWQVQQAENEKHFGDSYVYVYREADGHIERQSKSLPAPDGKKVSLVCVRDDGRIIVKTFFTRILRSEGLNAHSFRHTHATQLIENGAAPKGVAGRLGHSNTQITQNLYTHNTVKLQEETLAIFDKNLQTK
ncbi:MAG: site-specific integrase [Selenomonadaceae bacterium]|nr:site-specific integrase [Selenomonadaceae bacterium]MBR3747397.1 site-specific integrase [Selenomonadaceae bacterium]